MAFPTIPTVAAGRVVTGVQTTGGATKTFPSLTGLTKNAGDLLIAICIPFNGQGANEFSAWGASFIEFGDFSQLDDVVIGCAYKISDGTEAGTFTVTAVDAQALIDTAFFLLSIPGAHASAAPEGGGYTAAFNSNADPGSLSPSWGSDDTLWIAVAGCGENGTGGSFTGMTSGPASYSDYAETGISADVIGGIEGAVAFRQLAAASEDPGAFTNDTSNARAGAVTLAVRPVPPAPSTADPFPYVAGGYYPVEG